MSPTTVAITVEGVLVALVILFVVALLRSHAEILRRLSGLESGPPATAAATTTAGGGGIARDLIGETLDGDAVKLAPGARSSFPLTLLAFLSSGCTACGPLWATLREGARVPGEARLVIVTKSSDVESVTRLRELAPLDCELVMSTSAWQQYGVPGTPHFILVDRDSGRIAGRGTATSWPQLANLIDQATRDAAHGARQTSTTERAARAEEALARAGIVPGHPSLYPSRRSGGGEAQ